MLSPHCLTPPEEFFGRNKNARWPPASTQMELELGGEWRMKHSRQMSLALAFSCNHLWRLWKGVMEPRTVRLLLQKVRSSLATEIATGHTIPETRSGKG